MARGGNVPDYFKTGSQFDQIRLSNPASSAPRTNYVAEGLAGGPVGVIAAVAGDISERLKTEKQAEENLANAARLARTEMNLDAAIDKTAFNYESDLEGYRAHTSKMREKFLENFVDKDREQAALIFDKKAGGYETKILARQRVNQQQADKADLLAKIDQSQKNATAAIFRNDTVAANEEALKFEASRRTLFDSGLITPSEFVNMHSVFSDDLERAEIFRGFNQAKNGGLENAENFITDFYQNETYHPDLRDKFSAEMRRDLSILKAEKAVEINQIRGQAKTAITAIENGREYAGIEDLKTAAMTAGDAETLTALASVENLQTKLSNFKMLPFADMAKVIEAKKQGGISTDFDNSLISAMEKSFASSQVEFAKTPLEYAASRGIRDIQPVNPIDADSFKKRISDVEFLKEWSGNPQIPLFTKTETSGFKTLIDGQPIEAQVAILGAASAGLGSKYPEFLTSIKTDSPEFAHAGFFANSNPPVALSILEGVQISKSQTEFVPTNDEVFRSTFENVLPSSVLSAYSADHQAGVKKSVMAIYSKLSADAGDVSKQIDEDRLTAAVSMMTNGVVEYDRDGFGSFKTIAPARGMSSDEFTDFLDGLTDDDLGGNPPFLPNGEPVNIEDILDEGNLISVNDGSYKVEMGGELLVDGTGRPFVLNLGEIYSLKSSGISSGSGIFEGVKSTYNQFKAVL